jgi:Domain of unknown function (DUF4397)
MNLRKMLWRVTTLLALSTLLLGFPAGVTASYASASHGWITLANLSETIPSVDIYLSASGSAKPLLVLHDVAYGTVEPADPVSPGAYVVQMRTAGAAPSAKPILTVDLSVQAGRSYTVASLAGVGAKSHLQILNNNLTSPSGKSYVRVIQASIKQKSVLFYCSCGGPIASNAAPGSVSKYAAIPLGTWTMTATGPSSKGSLPVTLTAGTVHTEVVIDGPSGLEIVNLLDAAGAGQPPSGGVPTGFGGIAPHGPGSALPWLLVLVAGAMIALVGSFRLRKVVPKPRPEPTRM